MRKWISIVLTIMMVFGLMEMPAFAADQDEDAVVILTEDAGQEKTTQEDMELPKEGALPDEVPAAEKGALPETETAAEEGALPEEVPAKEEFVQEESEPAEEGSEPQKDPIAEDDALTDDEAEDTGEIEAAFDADVSLFTYHVEEDGSATITGYTGDPCENLTIPAEIDDEGTIRTVKAIGGEAFLYRSGFTGTLTIPASVTEIRHDAFNGCRGFTALVFAEGSALTAIGKNAFRGCSGMKNALDIPNTVTTIGEAAFSGCSSFIGDWKLPDNLETLSKEAFYNCCNIGGVLTIPAGVAEIGDYCFYMPNGHYSGWRGVEGLSFAEGSVLSRIGDGAFDGNWYLGGDLIFPETLTEIGSNAFYHTHSDRNGDNTEGGLQLPSGIVTIGARAFQYCGFSGDLVIPDSLAAEGASIGEEAFDQAGFTGTLTLPNTLKVIPKACFRNCDFTGELVLPENLEEVGTQGLGGCSHFEGSLVIPATLTTIGEGAFYGFGGTGTLTLPDTITVIESSAFNRAKFTGDLIIPDSVESIGYAAFEGCSGFTTLKLPKNEKYTKIEGDTFAAFGANLSDAWMGFVGELVIPDNVTEIGAYAFACCRGFTSVKLPAGLTSIGGYAFLKCKGLTGIDFPDSLSEIGMSAFQYCTGLKGDLTIPASMRTIGEDAFEGCTGLDGKLTIKYGLQTLGTEAFYGCTNLRGNIEIPASITSMGYHVFQGCESLESFTWPDTLTTIPRDTFSGCKGLSQELDLPDCVTSIQYGAFADCSGLTGTLKIPSGMTKIEDNTFSGCSGLSGALVIPDGVTEIGNKAFYGCSGFTGTLTLPANLTKINGSAFEDCTGFTGRLVIPGKVTNIGSSAFEGCSGFTGKLMIPASVTSLSGSAFDGCAGITELDMQQSCATLYGSMFANCTGLTGDMTIPAQITAIYWGIFNGCTNLTGTLTIPAQVTSVNSGALYGTHFSVIVNASSQKFDVPATPEGWYYADAAGAKAENIATGTYKLTRGSALIDISGAIVTAAGQKYTGKALQPVPQISLNGAVLNPANFDVTYTNNVKAGTATITVTGIESKGYKGTAKGTFTISRKKVTPSVSLKESSYVYNGKVKTPTVTVKAGSTTLKATRDYTVTYPSGRKAVGAYTVTVKLTGNYSGSGSATFKIVPKGTSVKSLTAGKKKITVKWTKQATQTSGYEIQCSLKKDFKKIAGKAKISGAKKTSGTITGLKKGSSYYVRIRTFKTGKNGPFYSGWTVFKKQVKVK